MNLENILKEYSNRTRAGGPDYQLRLDQQPPANAKAFVVAAKDSGDSGYKQFLFRSYPTPEGLSAGSGTNDCEVWQAGRATSAAPTYFEPFVFKRENYYDGGVIANNPVRVAIDEAQSLWPGREIGCVVSLGCGLFNREIGGGSLTETMLKAKDQLTATQPAHLKMMEDFHITYECMWAEDPVVEWMYADAGTAITRALAQKNPLRWTAGPASTVAHTLKEDSMNEERPINLRMKGGDRDMVEFANQTAARIWLEQQWCVHLLPLSLEKNPRRCNQF